MTHTPQPIRIGIYGCGRRANRTRLPNLRQIGGVKLVLCDVDPNALASTAATFGVSSTYRDAHRMLEAEPLDALYSLVKAHSRTDVEVAAAERGIHLFSEKPQALRLPVAACAIEDLPALAERHALTLAAAVPPSRASSGSHARLPERSLLVLGHETRGVPALPGAAEVCIPQEPSVESLNVAAAGAVLMAGWYAGRPA